MARRPPATHFDGALSKSRVWEDGKGCAVACTVHSGNHNAKLPSLRPFAKSCSSGRACSGWRTKVQRSWLHASYPRLQTFPSTREFLGCAYRFLLRDITKTDLEFLIAAPSPILPDLQWFIAVRAKDSQGAMISVLQQYASVCRHVSAPPCVSPEVIHTLSGSTWAGRSAFLASRTISCTSQRVTGSPAHCFAIRRAVSSVTGAIE
jgi:hypothetical protein